MNNFKSVGRHFLRDKSGQDLIEYALVAGLLALAALAGMNTLASQLSAAFLTIAASFNSAI